MAPSVRKYNIITLAASLLQPVPKGHRRFFTQGNTTRFASLADAFDVGSRSQRNILTAQTD
jgi:hypothetical protein